MTPTQSIHLCGDMILWMIFFCVQRKLFLTEANVGSVVEEMKKEQDLWVSGGGCVHVVMCHVRVM